LPADDARKHRALQLLEHLGIAEEARHVDQHVAIKRLGFVGVALDESRVVVGGLKSAQDHPRAPCGA
jgi:hypothetical protein